MQIGDMVYTKKLEYKSDYYSPETGRGTKEQSVPMKIRKARYSYRCRCGARINKGELHGADWDMHRCLDCITIQEPEAIFTKA